LRGIESTTIGILKGLLKQVFQEEGEGGEDYFVSVIWVFNWSTCPR